MADETFSEQSEPSEDAEGSEGAAPAPPDPAPTLIIPAALPDAPTVPTEAVAVEPTEEHGVAGPPVPSVSEQTGTPWFATSASAEEGPFAPTGASVAGSVPPTSAPGGEWVPAPPSAPPAPPAAPPAPPYGPGGWFAPEGPAGPSAPSGGRPSRRLGALVALAVLVAGAVGAGLGATLDRSAPSSSAPATLPSTTIPVGHANSVATIVKDIEPAVVDINAHIAEPLGVSSEQAAGTGMIISASGDVLTNNHVVAEGTTITAVVPGHTGSYPVKVLGVDPTADVALVKIVGLSNLPYVNLGNSAKVRVGDSVVAIGNALGLGGPPSSSSGTITATGRTITASDAAVSASETLTGLLETDAPIEAGDSGGPLVDSAGQVVGMVTAAASADTGPSIGFAIPIDTARAVAQRIERGDTSGGIILGESAFLGVAQAPSGLGNGGFGGFNFSPGFGNTGNTGNTGASPAGVQIGAVVAGGPAATAGIVAGDTITALNGVKTPTWTALEAQVARYAPGTRVVVSYLNSSGAAHSLTIALGGIPK